MKILKTIFGGGAEKLVESVGGVLDNLSTSKEEKSKVIKNLATEIFENSSIYFTNIVRSVIPVASFGNEKSSISILIPVL